MKWDGIEVNGSYPNIILIRSPLFSSTHASRGTNYFKDLQISGRSCATTILFKSFSLTRLHS